MPAAFLGMLLAHAGVGVFVAGVTLVKSYEAEREARLEPGKGVMVGAYEFRFEDVRPVEGPNYTASRAVVTVLRGGEVIARLQPEKRVYRVQQTPMTEAAIDYGLFRHLYVALGDRLEDGAWTLRAQVKPFVSWIWIGCLIMALGGVLAAADRRYRTVTRRAAPALAQGVRA
jgi:cytochrome c-type biogenesis protein CcmF